MSINVIDRDARLLSPDAQEELQIRMMLAVEGGVRQCVAHGCSGSAESVSLWRKAYRAGVWRRCARRPGGGGRVRAGP